MVELWPLIVVIGLAGVGAGVLAGLLGVGGGIILVPALEFAFGVAGVAPGLRMHLAVGTSLASIIPTALASARAHRARGAVDDAVTRAWGPAIAAGAVVGSVVASQVSGIALSLLFAAVALVMALRMLSRAGDAIAVADAPVGRRSRWIAGGIGMLSAMMGIGGGTLSVPVLCSQGIPVHRAVGTSSWLGLWIALPAAAGFALLGWGQPGLPTGSLGFVSGVALLVLLPATVLAAPLGAALAHRLPRSWLSRAFGFFLLLVALRMAWRSLA